MANVPVSLTLAIGVSPLQRTAGAAHAGNVATRMLSDHVGLTDALSGAMTRKGFTLGPRQNRSPGR